MHRYREAAVAQPYPLVDVIPLPFRCLTSIVTALLVARLVIWTILVQPSMHQTDPNSGEPRVMGPFFDAEVHGFLPRKVDMCIAHVIAGIVAHELAHGATSNPCPEESDASIPSATNTQLDGESTLWKTPLIYPPNST